VRSAIVLAVVGIVTGCDVFLLGDRPHRPDASTEVDAPADVACTADRDDDDVCDAIDPCIAAAADAAKDPDIDGLSNAMDACPFDANTGTNDTDMDGLYNLCDPEDGPDRHRCVMVFSDAVLNSALWRSRAIEAAWSTPANVLAADPSGVATIIAAESLEGVNTTNYDVKMRLDTKGQLGSVTLWLRANPDLPSSMDVGCRILVDGSGRALGVIGPGGLTDRTPVGSLGVGDLRMRASIVHAVGSNTTITCRMVFESSAPIVSQAVQPLLPGRFGITTDVFRIDVIGIDVIDRGP
jgi:hypothetical protein